MRNSIKTLTPLLLLAFAGAAAAADDFDWKEALAKGKTLEIKGVNGAIRAEAAAGAEAEVHASKHGRRSDPSSVEIQVVKSEQGVTICAVYPTPSNASSPNECRPGRGGQMSVRDNDVNVDFVVKVPAGVRFTGRTVNGDVEATGLSADAEARSVNGSVRVETTGLAQADTVNGSIHASLGRADWDGTLRFRSVNGSVSVTLPADASAEVSASTTNGDIDTDFPLKVQGRISRRSLRGTIGGGGRGLEIETVNGGISLRHP
jgi:Toastrack DUF4097